MSSSATTDGRSGWDSGIGQPSLMSDSTTCARWSASRQSQQQAYALLYLREHGSLPGGARDTLSIYNEINNSCLAAYNSGDEETVTLLQASKGDY